MADPESMEVDQIDQSKGSTSQEKKTHKTADSKPNYELPW